MSSITLSSFSSTISSTETPACTSVTPDKNGYVPYDSCGANYFYYPSFAAAIFFAVGFGLSLIVHVFQASHYKKWKFCWVLTMGVAWEFAAFVIRAIGTRKQQKDIYPVISTVLIFLAPMWINAFIYMVMGRMIYFFVPDQQLWGIKAVKIAKIFVWCDVIAFFVQLSGGVLINPDVGNSVMMTGIHIYMAGIGLQQIFIIFFITLSIRFHITMQRQTRSLQIRDFKHQEWQWRWLLYVTYATLTLITVRIIFRMVEFSSGVEPEDNPIPSHEAYFMTLDALPVFLACILLNLVHPGRFLNGEGSEFPKGPSRREKREIKRLKKEEKAKKKEEKKAQKMEKKNGLQLGIMNAV